ncbi:MAG: hypothetical protein M1831_003575 [Alyxoria varia]|nr:MAG: hypothetical protein M1831_003575 [Alyxoria varia]
MLRLTGNDLKTRLLALWKPPRWAAPPHRLGVAVSGGVDSMALAVLCKEIQDQHLQFKAFVVDHKARPHSTAEAEVVANRLKELGLDTDIRTIAWPSTTPPCEMNNFESQARTLRFQALGRACLESRTQGLLLAHHENDQAETVLLRILAGYLGFGLQGIKPLSNFPECHGLFGVHEGAVNVSSDNTDPKEPFSAPNSTRSASTGLSVFRPLLDVPKESLVATCKYFNVPWVEDATNRDPSLTMRNAVRLFLNDEKLPRSLQSRHLVELALLKRTRHALAAKHAESLLHKLSLCNIDKRSGRLTFEVREEDYFLGNLRRTLENQKIQLPTQVVLLAGRIAALVSPLEFIPTSTSQFIADKLFMAMLPQNDHETKKTTSLVPQFTAAGLVWSSTKKRGNAQSHAYSWDVTRQPLGRKQNMPTCEWSTVRHHEKHNPTNNSISSFRPWQLLDGRFWLKVWSSRYETVQARLLQEADLSSFLSVFDDSQKNRLKHLLKLAAPGKARWSLPVLIEKGSEQVLAIPTLRIQLPGTKKHLGWQVKYKTIQLGTTMQHEAT